MPPPVGFDFETAKEILRLVKKNKNGSLNRPIDSESPSLNNPQMVWAYVPSYQICTYDAEVKAWILPTAISAFPFNIGNDSDDEKQFGEVDVDGVIIGGFEAKIFIPKFGAETSLSCNAGFHIGFIFDYEDETEIPLILIGRPISQGGNAVITVVTDVVCTSENGLQVTTAEFSGADYDNAIMRQFLSLTDVTPISFEANAGRVVQVNSTADALEFGPVLEIELASFIALTDTPATYGASKADAYKSCVVASDGISIVFTAADITTTNSIEGGGNPHHSFTDIKLVGDTASPATDTFYGVDGNGDRAFRTIEITSLSDLPATLVGSGQYFLKVNAGETAIEFVEVDIQQILDDVADLLTDVATLQADYITLEARVTALE